MEERNDGEKGEELILPGFRFHPTDEELVGFYLKRKIQQRPLLIELIKQLDIYKYDPWDLPKFGGSGEKEWYFYCPRDRKYRNSARPNRVTGAGFWKATGTDRPIYSSTDGNKCIGLKKSLVFYKGRAAKGLKTDWMMHEFRLPSLADPTSSKRFLDKIIPPNDSWAICRIFKKTNSTTNRALSLSCNPPLSETNSSSNNNNVFPTFETNQYSSSIISNTYPFDFAKPFFNTTQPTNNRFTHLPILTELPPNYYTTQSLPDHETSTRVDLSTILLNMSSSVLGDFNILKPTDTIIDLHAQDHQQNYDVHAAGQPFGAITDLGKSTLVWDSSSSCPSDVSTSLSTNNCYT